MPCRTDEPTPQEQRAMYEEAFLHNSTLAEIFCKTMQVIESLDTDLIAQGEMLKLLPPETLKWWDEHKKRDRKRIEAELKEVKKERDKLAALGKLTPYERKLLGLA